MEKEDLRNVPITVVTYVNNATCKYASLMAETATKFANNPDNILFVLMHPIGEKAYLTIIDKPYSVIDIPINIENSLVPNKRGSHAHGYALNYLNTNNKFLTPIIVIIDADVAILYKGWDDVIREELSEQCCFGFNRPSYNFPSIFFFAFKKPIFQNRFVDFSPKVKHLPNQEEKTHIYKISNQKEAFYRKQEISSEVKCDTGYQLPMIFRGCGKGLVCISSVYNDQYVFLPHSEASYEYCKKNPWHMCEWHYNDKLFATHKQACRNHNYDGEYGKMWRKRIEWYICKNYPDIKLKTL